MLYWPDERQACLLLSDAKFNSCCKAGAVELLLICDPPAELQELYIFTNQDAVQFRKYIHHYNGAFAFTSANYNVDTRVPPGFSPFQIQGELYHLHGPLQPINGVILQFAQVWIHDP